MTPIILRDDQEDLKQRTLSDWKHGAQNVLNVLSTGGGKSIIMTDLVLDGARENKQQVVMAHRNELVSQLSLHTANRGIPHRIIGSDQTVAQITRQHRKIYGRSFVNPSAQTAVAGVDTIIARQEELKGWLHQVDRWYGDEAHHTIGGAMLDKQGNPIKDKNKEAVYNTTPNKWGKAVGLMCNAQGAGYTATPLRADGQGLGREYDGVFDTIQVGLDMRQLIDNGSLADYEIVCPESDLDMGDETTGKSGDWSLQKLKKASKKSRIIGDVVKAYLQHAHDKQAICFATDVETAGDIAKRFNEWGVRAVALSAKTNPAVREKYIEEFRAGILDVLVNVDLFDEGFDVPMCEVVIMARPTASLGKYRQMVGRALRTAEGKLYGLLIDHVSNVLRHGLPDKHIEWTLARRDKRGKQEKDPEEIELTVCKHCTKPYERFHLICPYCGLEPPLPVSGDRTIEMVDGDLILLDRATLERMRQATVIESVASVGERAPSSKGDFIGRGKMNKQFDKIEAHQRLNNAIAQWAAIQRLDGHSDREIEKKFYLTTGCDVLTALDGGRSRQEFEKMSERIEGWYSND